MHVDAPITSTSLCFTSKIDSQQILKNTNNVIPKYEDIQNGTVHPNWQNSGCNTKTQQIIMLCEFGASLITNIIWVNIYYHCVFTVYKKFWNFWEFN